MGQWWGIFSKASFTPRHLAPSTLKVEGMISTLNCACLPQFAHKSRRFRGAGNAGTSLPDEIPESSEVCSRDDFSRNGEVSFV